MKSSVKKKKWVLPVCILVGVLLLCAVIPLSVAGVMHAKGYGISVGRIYLSDTGPYLVDEGKTMILSDQSDDKALFDGLNTGDLILVVHDGVDESDPSQTGAHRIIRLRKGDETDLPENLHIGVVETDGTTDHGTTDHGTADHGTASAWKEDALNASPIAFDAQYIRTNGYHEEVKYPVVKIIRSVRELNAYYEANKGKYDLERKDTVYADTTVGFLDACEKYDDAYFEEHLLVMVLLEEGSGSIRHQVQSVTVCPDGQCCIYIDTIVPEFGTDDMAEWHILIEPEAGTEIENESDITVYVDGVNPLTRPELVQHGRGFANISLTIPNGWEYEMEDYAETNEFCIAFWPAGLSEGKIKVWYMNGFGVCGTGLTEEKITIGRYEAYKGTYDGSRVWEFIILTGTPGSYVILNEGSARWGSAYSVEAMRILNTLVVGDGFIGEAEASAIAKQEATVEYEQTRAAYDSVAGLWTVTLYQGNTAGGDQTVMITCEGKVIDIQYGE